MWHVYVIQCFDGSLYTGITTDVERRVGQHNAGTASKCTRVRRPVTLCASVPVSDRSHALKLEAHVKKQPRDGKLDALKKGL